MMGAAYSMIKRIFDRAASLLLIAALFPVMAAAYAAIALDTKGDPVYRQKRIGKGGKQFTLYKFRTMAENAEKKTGPVLSPSDDPRITRVGSFLRKTGLDELPQLFNVAKGEMSLVGPRPEREFFNDRLSAELPGWEKRLDAMPGITGLSQVKGIGSEKPEEKLRHDLEYISSMSLLSDFSILIQTMPIVLRIRKRNKK
jgi:lipopolysaccharide/colanic/teichoic acid biosynthesis glycosyltransferase